MRGSIAEPGRRHLLRHRPLIGDGDSLCIGPDPATWIEVRLSDFDAPELRSPTGLADRGRLFRIVAGRRLTCVAVWGPNGR